MCAFKSIEVVFYLSLVGGRLSVVIVVLLPLLLFLLLLMLSLLLLLLLLLFLLLLLLLFVDISFGQEKMEAIKGKEIIICTG